MADHWNSEREEPQRPSNDEERVRGVSEQDKDDEEFEDSEDLDEDDTEEDEGSTF